MVTQSEEFVMVHLEPYYNADGISMDSNRTDGHVGLTCFPGEELPGSNTVVHVEAIPFLFPSKEDGDCNNVECSNHSIVVPEDTYTMIHLLACSDNGSFKEFFEICYAGASVRSQVGVSDWTLLTPLYGEQKGFECSHVHSSSADIVGIKPKIWIQTLNLNPEQVLQGILLPDNPCLHIFALTLRRKVR